MAAFAMAAVTAIVLLAPPAALGAAAPAVDAATQQHQNQFDELNQKNQAPKYTGEPVVTSPAGVAGAPKPGGPKVLVRSVTFEPASAFLTQAELDAISSKYVGEKLDFAGIYGIVRDVNALYANKGIVTASAILPQQKLTDGNLTVDLVEGKVGNVTIKGPHNTRDKYILDRVHLSRNGVVDVPRAAKDIEYFNKTNQAQLQLQLQPGAAFGLTDLQLGIVEPQKNSLQFFIDNEGVDSTGAGEAGLYYHGYDLAGIDDNFTVYATVAAGSLAGTVSYDAPITTSGTRLAGTYTRSRIAVISGPQQPLDITGNSQAASVTLSQPLIGTKEWSVVASASGVYGTSDSASAGVPLVNSVTKKAVAGLAVSYASEGRSFNFTPQLIYANAYDALQGTSADIFLAAGTASFSIPLANDFSVYGQGAFQYTPTQLLPGDLLFQIGGPTTVRGYPTDAVAGDSGYYAELELHRELDQVVKGLDVYAFTDFGQVMSTFPAVTTLASAGAGISWNYENRATATLSVGVPLLNALASQSAYEIYTRIVVHAF